MQNKTILNLALLVVLLSLVTIALLHTEEGTALKTIGNFKRSEINQIDISYRDRHITLERQQDQWLITQPVHIEADFFRVDSILNLTEQSAEKAHLLTDDEKPKFGLDKPQAVLKLNGQTFTFGTDSALGEKQYVATEGKLYLVDNQIFALITSGYHNLIRRYLLPENAVINSVAFNNNMIMQDANGSWTLETNSKPVESANADKLKTYIDNLQALQAFTVQRTRGEMQGIKFTITYNDNQQRQFLLQQTESTTMLHLPALNISYQFHHDTYETLINPVADEKPETAKKDSQ